MDVPQEPHAPSPKREELIIFGSLFEGSLGGLALLVGHLARIDVVGLTRASLKDIGLGIIGTVPMFLMLVAVLRLPGAGFRSIRRFFEQEFVPLFKQCHPLELLLLSGLAGWGEELLFRGLIQSWLNLHVSPFLSLCLTSVLFGLAHLITKTYAVIAALVGLYLGALWLWSDNLMVPIVTHALYDFVALIYLTRRNY